MQDIALNLPMSTTIADSDDKTELIDGTALDNDSTMDQTAWIRLLLMPKPLMPPNVSGISLALTVRPAVSSLQITRVVHGVHPSDVTSHPSPLDFFKEWLATHGSSAPNRCVHFDSGGELGNCTAIHNLFCHAGGDVEVTAP